MVGIICMVVSQYKPNEKVDAAGGISIAVFGPVKFVTKLATSGEKIAWTDGYELYVTAMQLAGAVMTLGPPDWKLFGAAIQGNDTIHALVAFIGGKSHLEIAQAE